MSASQHVAAISQRIVILIVEILPCQLTISLARAALICQKQIFRNRVGLVPRPTLVLIWPSLFSMLNGMLRKMGQRGVGGAFENRESIGITNVPVRIDQPTNQLVVTVRGEAVLVVVIA